MNKKTILTGIILVLILAGFVFSLRKMKPPAAPQAVQSGEKMKGPETAPVKIVEYSDFQCPACGRAQESLNKIFQAYPGKIQIVFRHFPLKGHLWSPLAHQAAECAHRQGKFWEYHDKLYGGQKAWSGPQNPTELFFSYAKETGLNLDAFAACFADMKVERKILEEQQRGESLQVSSTPSFFINGERVVGPIELEMKGDAKIREILGLPPKASEPLPQAATPTPNPAPTQ